MIEEDSDNSVHDIRYPHRQPGRSIATDGEGLSNSHKQDVRETQHQAYTYIHTHASPHLARRERETNNRKNECGGCHRKAFLIFQLKLLQVGHTTSPLLVDIVAQLW